MAFAQNLRSPPPATFALTFGVVAGGAEQLVFRGDVEARIVRACDRHDVVDDGADGDAATPLTLAVTGLFSPW